ncbi:MAG: glycosyltransferase family 4 protein [Candidatus Micrarchaeota archaeon]
MNVLLISDFSYPLQGGTERHVTGVAEYLASRRLGVHVLSPARKDEGNCTYKVNGVIVHKFDLPFMHTSFIVRSMAYFFLGIWLCLKHNIKTVHSFYTMTAIIPAALVARILGKKYIATLFEWELFDWQRKSKWKWPISRWAFGTADAITTIGPTFQRKMEAEFPEKQVIDIGNWIDDKYFKLQKPIGKPSKKNEILFMGRLVRNKGIYVLLDALSKIEDDLKFRLILAGPPVEQQKVREISKRFRILDRIEFRGFVPDGKMAALYSECDILVFPSILRGGMAFVVMEAMAYGKPVVCSDDLGLREGVGGAGIIVKKGDSKGLAQAIKKLLTDRAAYSACSRIAIERVKTYFLKDKVLPLYYRVHRNVAGK